MNCLLVYGCYFELLRLSHRVTLVAGCLCNFSTYNYVLAYDNNNFLVSGSFQAASALDFSTALYFVGHG